MCSLVSECVLTIATAVTANVKEYVSLVYAQVYKYIYNMHIEGLRDVF